MFRYQPDRDGTNDNTYVWHPQAEVGSSATEYQPVEGDLTDLSTAPTGYTIPRLVFSGVLGSISVNDYVTISCKNRPPNMTPRHRVLKGVFNHLPRTGDKIETPKQTIIVGDF